MSKNKFITFDVRWGRGSKIHNFYRDCETVGAKWIKGIEDPGTLVHLEIPYYMLSQFHNFKHKL